MSRPIVKYGLFFFLGSIIAVIPLRVLIVRSNAHLNAIFPNTAAAEFDGGLMFIFLDLLLSSVLFSLILLGAGYIRKKSVSTNKLGSFIALLFGFLTPLIAFYFSTPMEIIAFLLSVPFCWIYIFMRLGEDKSERI